jgi:hypothetical protein
MTIDKDASSPPSAVRVEEAAFDLDRWKAEEDIKLRRGELEIKQKEASKSVWSSPLVLGMIGLFATVLASIVQNACQTYASQNLERQKFESTLILKALETDDQSIAALRFKRYLDLDLIKDQNGKIAGWVRYPPSIPLDSAEFFSGVDRKTAKLSVGSGTLEFFDDLAGLIASLPSNETMLSHSPRITTNAASGRVAEEQRNVHFNAFLYAASREADNDFVLILGRAPNAAPPMYMIAEVSGLPPKESPAYLGLSTARSAFERFFSSKLPGDGYDFYSTNPIPVVVEGSLFWDAVHSTGQVPGPPSLKAHMPTTWEVHPVTSIKLGQ